VRIDALGEREALGRAFLPTNGYGASNGHGPGLGHREVHSGEAQAARGLGSRVWVMAKTGWRAAGDRLSTGGPTSATVMWVER
jgi:hypothetical protein